MKFQFIGKNKTVQFGFLLLEALLAITVVAAGTIAIMRTYGNSIAAGIISQQYLTASNLIEQKIWEAVSPKTISSGETSGQFEDPYSDYQWEISITETFPEVTAPDEIEENSVPVAVNQDGTTTEVQEKEPVYILYIIKVTVSWSYKKDQKQLTYETATMRKQPEDKSENGANNE